MTVSELIQQYDAERANSVQNDLKLLWLRKIEKQAEVEVFSKYDGYKDSEIKREGLWVDRDGGLHLPSWMYVDDDGTLHITNEMEDEEFTLDSELAIPDPYTDVYFYYLDQRIAYNNNDSRRYNVATEAFNNAYLAFQQFYNRSHQPDRPMKHMLRHEVL